jgi:hypothetical protein
MTANSNEEKKESFTTYDQYIISFFATFTLMFIGAAYFYSRIYRPLINEKNNPEMSTPEFIARALFYGSPSPDSEILKRIPDFKGKCLFPEGTKINSLTGLVEDSSSESLVSLAEEIGNSIPFSGAVGSIPTE